VDVNVLLSPAVQSWSFAIVSGAQWLSASVDSDAVGNSHLMFAVNTSSLCSPGQGYPSSELEGRAEIIALSSLSGSLHVQQHVVTVVIYLTVLSPLAVVIPGASTQLFVWSASMPASSAPSRILNGGNAPLVVDSVTVVEVYPGDRLLSWSVEPQTMVVPSQGTADMTLFAAPGTAVPPDTYDAAVVFHTNVPQCGTADTLTLTVPWTVRVVDALLFPSGMSVALVAGQPPVVQLMSVVNFAGETVTCTVDTTDSLFGFNGPVWVWTSVTLLQLDAGALGSFQLMMTYPTDVLVAFVVQPVTVAVDVLCRRISDGGTLHNMTAVAAVTLMPAVPFADTSAAWFHFTVAAPGSMSVLAPGSTFLVVVLLRDVGGNVIPDIETVSAAITVSVSQDPDGSSLDAQLVTAATLENTTAPGALAYSVAMPVSLIGPVTVRVLVYGYPVPAGAANVLVVEPNCGSGEMLLPSTQLCTCIPGSYLEGTTGNCTKCPVGTYKPLAGSTTLSQCLPCTSGWYCDAGSVLPTARCPEPGFSCTTGTLTVQPGYWVENGANLTSALPMFAAVKCELIDACPNTDGSCRHGYEGRACATCTAGFAHLRLRCLACSSRALGIVLLLVWVAAVVLVSAFVLSLALEEIGVTRQRNAWVDVHGTLLSAQLLLLRDTLQILALQFQVPSQLPASTVLAAMSVAGPALGPGAWPPVLCAFTGSVTVMLLPLFVVPMITGAAIATSMLFAPSVWRQTVQRPLRLWRRVSTVVPPLVWFAYPSVVWATANRPGSLPALCFLG